jgi:hypothetical protein
MTAWPTRVSIAGHEGVVAAASVASIRARHTPTTRGPGASARTAAGPGPPPSPARHPSRPLATYVKFECWCGPWRFLKVPVILVGSVLASGLRQSRDSSHSSEAHITSQRATRRR